MSNIKTAVLGLILIMAFREMRAQDEVLKYSMKTSWGENVDPDNLWNEYPRPQMVRNNWINLNGYWEYAIREKSKARPAEFDGKILVPFAVESDYGGVKAFKDFINAAHERGIAVVLDVVYNHLGPKDLDMWQFDGWQQHGLGGIYFYNDWRSKTPWADTRPDYGRPEVRRACRASSAACRRA